jgi:hypothetical protein
VGEENGTVGVSESIGSGVADMDAVGVSVGSGVMDGLGVSEGVGVRVGLCVLEGEGVGVPLGAALGSDCTAQATRESTRPMKSNAFIIRLCHLWLAKGFLKVSTPWILRPPEGNSSF